MKNAFIVSSLILTAAYPVALLAETVGLVSFSLPSFSSILGAYAAAGVLAFAFRDYSRRSTPAARRVTAPAPQTGLRALSLSNSQFHAN
jgi:hypothetical protein